MKTILVSGSARNLNDEAKVATRAIGTALAENGFGLVTGSWPGVDKQTSDAFITALTRSSKSVVGRYIEVHYRRFRPFSAVSSRHSGLRTVVTSGQAAHEELVRRCDAGILIGGIGGAKKVARELINSGRPVLPLPLTGGDALEAYADALERWSDHPVPGMTRSQFMNLSLPLGGRATGIIRLLRAALHDVVDVFICYRRSDLPGVAGRLAERLFEHFGPKRVFLDMHSIAPGATFPMRIDQALTESRVMACLIGPHWDLNRLADETDYVRREIENMLHTGRPVIPIVAFGGSIPERDDLPLSMSGLLDRQAVRIDDNASWEPAMVAILSEVDRIVGEAAVYTSSQIGPAF